MRRAAFLALVAIMVGGLATHAAGQDASPGEELTFVSVDKRESPRITMTVAAPASLTGEDLSESFEVRQDGEQRSVEATPVAGTNLEVALVIDTSASILGPPLDAAKAAAAAFLEGLPDGAEIAVVGFGTTAYVASALSTDRAAARAAIDGLSADGETAIYDAVTTALAEFSPDAQRSIVLLTDGYDTASATTLEDAAGAMASTGVGFYGVTLETTVADAAALAALAEAAGGPAVSVSDPSALAGIYQEIASQYTNQYQLTFEAKGTGTTEFEARLRKGDFAASVSRAVDIPQADAPTEEGASPSVPTVVSAPSNDWALPVGLAAVFVGFLVTGLIAFAPRRRTRDERERAPRLQRGFHVGQLSDLTHRATQLAERSLEQRGRRLALNDALEHAGIAMRPGEFLVLAISMSVVGFAVGILLMGPLAGLVFLILVLGGFRFSVSFLGNRRRSKFGSQLSDTLQLLAGTLRAGYGMLQAIDAVAREADSPTAEEFGRIVIETRLGRDVAGSLHAAAKRMGNEDFDWVVQAIDIHREVGGDLTEVLDTVSGTIRERDSLRRQVKALSAEGRLSAGILFALPIAMFGLISLMNPAYMADLTGTAPGRFLIGVAGLMLLVGGLWLRKIVRLVY